MYKTFQNKRFGDKKVINVFIAGVTSCFDLGMNWEKPMNRKKPKMFCRLRLRATKYHASKKYYRRNAKLEAKAEIEDWRQQVEERIILLASDETSFVNKASKMFENAGYIALEASNGFKAWKMYEEQKYEISLLVADDSLPIISGEGLAELVRKTKPDLPVILRVSQQPPSRPECKLDSLERTYFLDKSASTHSLRSLVEKILGRPKTFKYSGLV